MSNVTLGLVLIFLLATVMSRGRGQVDRRRGVAARSAGRLDIGPFFCPQGAPTEDQAALAEGGAPPVRVARPLATPSGRRDGGPRPRRGRDRRALRPEGLARAALPVG